MKDTKENYVQVGEPQKGISSTLTYTGQPKWENVLREKINGIEAYDYSTTTEEIINFVHQLLKSERQELKKKVEDAFEKGRYNDLVVKKLLTLFEE